MGKWKPDAEMRREARFALDSYETLLDELSEATQTFRDNLPLSRPAEHLLANLIVQQIETRRLLGRILAKLDERDG